METHLAIVILSYPTDPNRLGDVAFIPDGTTAVLGRDAASELRGAEVEVTFARQRPGSSRKTGPLTARTLSRRQLLFRAKGDTLQIENLGQAPLILDAPDPKSAHIGCTIAIGKTLLLACTKRPEQLPPLAHYPSTLVRPAFGVPDAHGFAGESASAWELRDHLAEASAWPNHVLLRGVTGSGRGSAARIVHALSTRGGSIPAVIVDAAALDANDAAHLFTKKGTGFLAMAANARTSLIIERADVLPPQVQALLADAVEIGTKTPDKLRLIMTIDPRTDTSSSPLFRAVTLREVEIPSFGARIEDVWSWFLAAGAETEAVDVDAMIALTARVRRAGWAAVLHAVPSPSIPIRDGGGEEESAPTQ